MTRKTDKGRKAAKISKRRKQYLLEQYLAAYREAFRDALGYYLDGNATKEREKEQEAAYWREKRIAIRRGYELSCDPYYTRRGALLDALMSRKREDALKTAVKASKTVSIPLLDNLYPEAVNLPL